MSILSIEDIKKELGNNIYIYPLKKDNIKAHSINLTASKFAWSLSDKTSIYNESENQIEIPPNDTALIYTNESIYVENNIGGTYHSKVSLVSNGLGHIGTTLDPQYLGLSLIAIHNHNSETYNLKVNSSFVSIIFYYLKTATYEKSHNNEASQATVLQGFEEYSQFENWFETHNWAKNERNLKSKLKNSDDFKNLKEEMKEERKNNNILEKIKYCMITKYLLITILGFLIVPSISKIIESFGIDTSIGVILAAYLTVPFKFITNDISNYVK